MRGKPQKLRIQHELAAAHAPVRQHDRAHLVEQQLLRDTAEPLESRLQPAGQHRHRLPGVEAQPQQPGVAQHHHQGVPAAPRQGERREVNLALTPRRRLEPHHRLGQFAGANRPDVVPHAAVAAGVARRADLVKQPLRRQPRELLEAGIDDPRVVIQLVGHRRPRRVARATRRQVGRRAVFSVNYFCRFGATILAGSVRHQSAAGTPPSRPGRKAHNCHPSRGAVGVSSARAGAQLSPGSTPHRYVTDP